MLRDITKYIYRLFLLICYHIISFLVNITNGNKKLILVKIALGILLLTINNPLRAQTDTISVKSFSDEKDTITYIDEVVVNGWGDIRTVTYTMCYATVDVHDTYNIYYYVREHIVYPKKALKNKIEGIVKVKFSVRKNGKIKNIKIIERLGYGCDREVIRLLKKYNWTIHNKPKFDEKFEGNISIEFKLPEK
jgi:TonB family protein